MTLFTSFVHCSEPADSNYSAAARWIEPAVKNESVERGLEELKLLDRAAWVKLQAYKKLAYKGRLRIHHVEAREVTFPAGRNIRSNEFRPDPVPLMMGIKCDDHRENVKPGKGLEYRIYFGDVSDSPVQVPKRMVATYFFKKGGKLSGESRQDQAIKKSMKALIWWCARQDHPVSYRPWGQGELRR